MPFRIVIALIVEILASIGCVTVPYWGFLFFVIWTILRPQDDRPNVAALHYPMVLLCAVMLGSLPRIAKAPEFSWFVAIRKLFLVLVFFVLMTVSALATGFTEYSSFRVEEFLVVVITCFLLIFWASEEKRIWGVLGCFLVAGVQVSRDALTRGRFYQESFGDQVHDRITLRLNQNWGGTNYLGLLMAILIVISLNLLWTRYSKWVKIAGLGAAGVFLVVFLKANSRGASLGLGASLIVYWLMHKRKGVTLVLLVLLVIGVFAFGPASYFDRLGTIVNYEDDPSAMGRLELWNIGLRLIREHPLFGVGPDNFMMYAFNGPHDAYIQAAAEMGIPAAIVYCAILIGGFRSCFLALRLIRNLPDNQTFRAAAITVTCMLTHTVVQGFTTGFAHREFVYYFVTLAHCVYLTARRQEPLAQPQPVPAAATFAPFVTPKAPVEPRLS